MAKPRKVHTYQSLMAKTVEEGTCLLWTGYQNQRVPTIYVDGTRKSVRGLFAKLLNHSSADGNGFWVNTCGNQLCVRPEHTAYRSIQQQMSYMGKRMRALPSIEAIRRAKISNSMRRISDEQIKEIHQSGDSAAAVAKRLGVSKALVTKYRRSEIGATMATNMWAGLM